MNGGRESRMDRLREGRKGGGEGEERGWRERSLNPKLIIVEYGNECVNRPLVLCT